MKINQQSAYGFENKEQIILRDYLALERTRLANERTLFSYIRTSLYLFLGGIAFLQFKDFTREEFEYVFERTRWIKNQFKSYQKYWPLSDRTLVMIFEKASTRTRLSFEAGMQQLAGCAILVNTRHSPMGGPIPPDWWEGGGCRAEVLRRLKDRDGIAPDDVIMSPDQARRKGLTSTVTFPVGNIAPNGSVIKSTSIDPSVVDKFGIPVLRFNTKYSEQEVNQAKHMKESFREIMHKMGAVITWGDDTADNQFGLAKPGEIIHEAGTVRMGNDPKKSALNKWSQAHDCKNLFCVDGGQFVSQADKNITWTILALSMRASEYIVDEMKKQNL